MITFKKPKDISKMVKRKCKCGKVFWTYLYKWVGNKFAYCSNKCKGSYGGGNSIKNTNRKYKKWAKSKGEL